MPKKREISEYSIDPAAQEMLKAAADAGMAGHWA